jgi:hypothetical protein
MYGIWMVVSSAKLPRHVEQMREALTKHRRPRRYGIADRAVLALAHLA